MRIKFNNLAQKDFLEIVRIKLRSPSTSSILQFGFSTTLSALKNYNSGRRLIPVRLFNEMIYLAKLDVAQFDFNLVEANWGQIKGGKCSKRGSLKN